MPWEDADEFLANLAKDKKQRRGFGPPLSPVEPAKQKKGFVYFIAEKDEDGGDIAIKIGYSGKPWKRRKGLQTGNSKRLETLLQVPGTEQDEARLHALLSRHNIHLEQFRPHEEVYQAMEWCRQFNSVPAMNRSIEEAGFLGVSVSPFGGVGVSGVEKESVLQLEEKHERSHTPKNKKK